MSDAVFMTADEVAKFLQVSRPTVYELVKQSRLPKPYKASRVVRWDEAEVIAAVKKWPRETPVEGDS
jgi:excisionase family DNA binding protein